MGRMELASEASEVCDQFVRSPANRRPLPVRGPRLGDVGRIHQSNGPSIYHSDRCPLPNSFHLPGKGFEGGLARWALVSPTGTKSPLRMYLVEDQNRGVSA